MKKNMMNKLTKYVAITLAAVVAVTSFAGAGVAMASENIVGEPEVVLEKVVDDIDTPKVIDTPVVGGTLEDEDVTDAPKTELDDADADQEKDDADQPGDNENADGDNEDEVVVADPSGNDPAPVDELTEEELAALMAMNGEFMLLDEEEKEYPYNGNYDGGLIAVKDQNNNIIGEGFCINSEYSFPDGVSEYKDGTFDDNYATPEQRDLIMRILYYGAPNDAAEIVNESGITRELANSMTQYLIWAVLNEDTLGSYEGFLDFIKESNAPGTEVYKNYSIKLSELIEAGLPKSPIVSVTSNELTKDTDYYKSGMMVSNIIPVSFEIPENATVRNEDGSILAESGTVKVLAGQKFFITIPVAIAEAGEKATLTFTYNVLGGTKLFASNPNQISGDNKQYQNVLCYVETQGSQSLDFSKKTVTEGTTDNTTNNTTNNNTTNNNTTNNNTTNTTVITGDVLGAAREQVEAVVEEGQVLGAARSPKTGDSSRAILWMLVMGCSATAAAAVLASKKEQ